MTPLVFSGLNRSGAGSGCSISQLGSQECLLAAPLLPGHCLLQGVLLWGECSVSWQVQLGSGGGRGTV